MATIQHSLLTSTDLHEPKGISTASSGEVYVADGTGSGSWTNLNQASYTSIASGGILVGNGSNGYTSTTAWPNPSGATAGQIYIADGAGSGSFKTNHFYVNGYIAFDSVTPAYQHSVTTSFTLLNPTFSVSLAQGFTGETSPNSRLIYTGADDIISYCQFAFNFKQASGTARNLEVIFYLNGAPMNGGHIVVTANSGEWKSATLVDSVQLSQNDYIEIAVKGDSAFTLDVASASLIIDGGV